MKRIVLGIVLGASAIGGCAAQSQSSPPPAKEPVMTCNRDAGQAFIGKKATPEIGAELQIVSTHFGLSFRLSLPAGAMAGTKLA